MGGVLQAMGTLWSGYRRVMLLCCNQISRPGIMHVAVMNGGLSGWHIQCVECWSKDMCVSVLYAHAPLLIPPALTLPQRQEFQMGRTAHARGRFADSTRAWRPMGVF